MYSLTDNEIERCIDICSAKCLKKFNRFDIDESRSIAGEVIAYSMTKFNGSEAGQFYNYVYKNMFGAIFNYLVKNGKMKYTYYGRDNKKRTIYNGKGKYRNALQLDYIKVKGDYSNALKPFDIIDENWNDYNYIDDRDSFNDIVKYLKSLPIEKFGDSKWEGRDRKVYRKQTVIRIFILYYWKEKKWKEIGKKVKISNINQIHNRVLIPLLKEYYIKYMDENI